jgi:hypothetical protein
MATTFSFYDDFHKYLMDGTVDLDTDTIKVMLVSSAYTFSAAHTVKADLGANEITGPGYTAGGITLANVAVTQTGGVAKFDADDTGWTTATFTCRAAVLYKSGVANALTDPLIGYILFDDTPADVGVSNGTFQIQWHANGIFTLA